MMQEIINKIIEIEMQAQKMKQEALKRKESYAASIDNETAEMRDAYLRRARERIEKVKMENDRAVEELLLALEHSYQEKRRKILNQYAEKRADWIERIYQAVVS